MYPFVSVDQLIVCYICFTHNNTYRWVY